MSESVETQEAVDSDTAQTEEVVEAVQETAPESSGDAENEPQGFDAFKDSDAPTDGADDKAPAEYSDFDVPEGVQMDHAALESARTVFSEVGITQEQGQKMVNLFTDIQAQQQREAESKFAQDVKAAVEQLKADPELGGDGMAARNANIDKVFASSQFGAQARDTLVSLGLHADRNLYGLLSDIGAFLADDVVVTAGSREATEASPRDRLFPSSVDR